MGTIGVRHAIFTGAGLVLFVFDARDPGRSGYGSTSSAQPRTRAPRSDRSPRARSTPGARSGSSGPTCGSSCSRCARPIWSARARSSSENSGFAPSSAKHRLRTPGRTGCLSLVLPGESFEHVRAARRTPQRPRQRRRHHHRAQRRVRAASAGAGLGLGVPRRDAARASPARCSLGPALLARGRNQRCRRKLAANAADREAAAGPAAEADRGA